MKGKRIEPLNLYKKILLDILHKNIPHHLKKRTHIEISDVRAVCKKDLYTKTKRFE